LAREDPQMLDTLSVALVCAAVVVAAVAWFVATRRRGGLLDDVIGDAVGTASFAICILITLDVTSGTAVAGVIAAAVLLSVGARLRRAFAR
jgi:hypothetical protein